MDNRSLYMEYIDAALFDSYSKMNHCVQNDYYKVTSYSSNNSYSCHVIIPVPSDNHDRQPCCHSILLRHARLPSSVIPESEFGTGLAPTKGIPIFGSPQNRFWGPLDIFGGLRTYPYNSSCLLGWILFLLFVDAW